MHFLKLGVDWSGRNISVAKQRLMFTGSQNAWAQASIFGFSVLREHPAVQTNRCAPEIANGPARVENTVIALTL
ncbi:hypothetical protein BCAR13_60184 [Paraburkholderia caribensis]|nr:hypothetical protein BCAR13_60184 [Paraburkholderia caribensis]